LKRLDGLVVVVVFDVRTRSRSSGGVERLHFHLRVEGKWKEEVSEGRWESGGRKRTVGAAPFSSSL